jgi:hypothetical protein
MANVDFGDEKLFPVFMPSLLWRFRLAEEQSGSPLTSTEAKAIRDNAVGVLLPEPIALRLQQRRGFRDLDPDRFWTDWQQVRSS